MSKARRATIPQLELVSISEDACEGAAQISLSRGDDSITYFCKPVRDASGKRVDGGPEWAMGRYLRFPSVLNADGSPWREACVYLTEQAELKVEPNMLSLGTLAGDLADFKRFADEEGFDWRDFSKSKFLLPTYRYKAWLMRQVRGRAVSAGVAKRRMNVVIRFYRWFESSGLWSPASDPWQEREIGISYRDATGRAQVKPVTTTDLRIDVPDAEDPWDECVDDGGRLRPLPADEQHAVLSALHDLGNTEVSLAHKIALVTGAREQTVLTIRLKHVKKAVSAFQGSEVRLVCGPGTGIDTKRSKKGVLHLPRELYEALHVYSISKRAKARRAKHGLADHDDQYLFLTSQGNPFYESIEDRHRVRLNGAPLKSFKSGQSLRSFISNSVIPMVREHLKSESFAYSFHDLRATFGMNYVDFHIQKSQNEPALETHMVRELSSLMWHGDLDTTLRYLHFRRKRRFVERADDEWTEHLNKLCRGPVSE